MNVQLALSQKSVVLCQPPQNMSWLFQSDGQWQWPWLASAENTCLGGFAHMLLNYLQNTDQDVCTAQCKWMQMCTYAHVWIHAWYTAQTPRANWVENMSVTWFDVSRYAPKLPCPTLYCSTTCNTCCLTRHTGQLLWRVNTCCAAHRHCCGLLDMERSIWRMKYGFYSWDDTFICFAKANRSINLCSNQLNFLITTKDKDILLYMTTIEMTEWKWFKIITFRVFFQTRHNTREGSYLCGLHVSDLTK